MTCQKCRGLLVAKEYTDLQMGASCWMATCLNCGRAFDETSILNKYNPPSVKKKQCKAREFGVRI